MKAHTILLPVVLVLLMSVVIGGFGGSSHKRWGQDGTTPNNEGVILLHGMGRTSRSMKKMERYLIKNQYSVLNATYPSTKHPIETLATNHVATAVKEMKGKGCTKIHFVTHSMGGILVRQYLQEHRLPDGSRIVMLSPPNQGSEVAEKLKGVFFYKWIVGPAGQQLCTGPGSLPLKLAPIKEAVGIITGSRSLDPWFSPVLPGPDDGKVSVTGARLKEMDDFMVIPSSHAFIMKNKRALEQTIHFLRNGKFKPKS